MKPRQRKVLRWASRTIVRRAYRTTVRVRWRTPDDLVAALTAFRRAIRAHHRLARLAPRFFDSAVVDRERRERQARRRWMTLWEPALAKVYRCEPKPYDPMDDLPPLPSLRTQRAVERELVAWNFWMSAGRAAIARHQQRRPHALPDLSRVARLLQIAMDFRQLACGLDSSKSAPESSTEAAAWADLKRAYGHLCSSSPANSGSAPTIASSEMNQAPVPGPGQSSAPVYAGDQSTTPLNHEPSSREIRDLNPHLLDIGSHGHLCQEPI